MKAVQLRSYQSDLLQQVSALWSQGAERVLLQCPTGSGKTETAVKLIQDVISKDDTKVVWLLVHRKELLWQLARKLQEHEMQFSYIAAGEKFDLHAKIQLCSIPTLAKKITIANDGRTKSAYLVRPHFIIADEAHHCASASYEKIQAWISSWSGNRYTLGLTATPRRLDGRPLSPYFDELIKGPSIQQLIDDSWLCRPEVYVPPKSVQMIETMRDNWHTALGDYKHADVENDLLNNKLIYGDAVSHWKQLADNQPTVVFCTSVKHCHQAAVEFEEAGIPSAAIDGSMGDDERRRILDQLRDGTIKCVMSCDLIGEGVDIPLIGCAVLLRPTQSLTIFLQQVGRAMRPSPGKEKTVIIDHVNNTALHGLPWLNRFWTLDGYKDKEKVDYERNITLKLCPRCGNYSPSGSKLCSECKYEFALSTKEKKLALVVPTKLVKISPAQALAREKYRMSGSQLKTKDDFLNFAVEKGWNNPEVWAEKAFKQKQADDKVFFEGTEAELTTMFASRKNPPADIPAEVKKALVRREASKKDGRVAKQAEVYRTGTFAEIVAHLEVTPIRQKDGTFKLIEDKEKYARAILRNGRLKTVFESGTREQKIEAAKLMNIENPGAYVDKVDGVNNGSATASNGNGSSGNTKPVRDFDSLVAFGKTINAKDTFKFAQNVILKDNKAVLDGGTDEEVLAVLKEARVANPDGFLKSVLARRNVPVGV